MNQNNISVSKRIVGRRITCKKCKSISTQNARFPYRCSKICTLIYSIYIHLAI
nr:MAG TPA: DNA gyrase subunit A [Caudoviricetes sp.]